jgi:hypothetical protein
MLAESGLYVLNVRIRNALEQVFECVYMHYMDPRILFIRLFIHVFLFGGFFFHIIALRSRTSYIIHVILYYFRHCKSIPPMDWSHWNILVWDTCRLPFCCTLRIGAIKA